MTSPLDSVSAEEIARYLAERQVRVYSLPEVAEMTGFALRDLEVGCRNDTIEHTRRGRTRGMTLRQVELLVARHARGATTTAPATADADDVQQARELSRRSGARRTGRRAA